MKKNNTDNQDPQGSQYGKIIMDTPIDVLFRKLVHLGAQNSTSVGIG